MNVLIACEESQEVCKSFRERGHRAFSCDIQEPSGGHPEWHILGDCLPLINGRCKFETMDGKRHEQPDKWDLLIAHPPCTYLTVAANKYYDVSRYGDKARERMKERYKAIVFFMRLVLADCDKIAIENPVGIMSTAYRNPDCIIQPFEFGEDAQKATCFWLKGLPNLEPTNVITPTKITGKSYYASKWHDEAWSLPAKERAKVRSKTFPGIARAMAVQWG